MTLPFYKYEGLGNDFVIVETSSLGDAPMTVERAIAICDRHRGVGADGVLIVDVDVPRMDVINADGSVPEMCGNGLRCVALHLTRRANQTELDLTIETAAGPHQCTVVDRPGSESVAVEMAVPSMKPRDLPLSASAPWLDHPLDLEGRTTHWSGVSMGNPHAVTFDDVGEARLQIGPALQREAHFPEGVNVGFVSDLRDTSMTLDVLERGVGWTLACGTGACAAAVAAVESGRAARHTPLRVTLPGGTLTITVGEEGEAVRMDGPARAVFRGETEL